MNKKNTLKLHLLFYTIISCGLLNAQVITPLPQKTGITTPIPVYIPRITGYVDMHTHPMSHLAFGGKIMYGTPDLTTLGLAGSFYAGFDVFKKECNTVNETAGNLEKALGNCNAMHGGAGADNDCGNYIRAEIVNSVDKVYRFKQKNGVGDLGHMDHPHGGYPNFISWPDQSGVSHQQMWYEWIQRAFRGGLKIMVALAVNNSLLAKAAGADQFIDDKSSVELQLIEMKKFVNNHSDFMEIAKTPADALRIVRANKLAVVLGVETDDIGNLTRRSKIDKETININQVRAELQNLYTNFDVRYIFPIHFSDNVFGGTAVNDPLFALSTKYYTNNYVSVRESIGEDISYKHHKENFDFIRNNALKMQNLGWVIEGQPEYTAPTNPAAGHANVKGLGPLGSTGILEMMKMGMMIDIDHMSQRSMTATLALSHLLGKYPLNAGHTGIRPVVGGNERNLYRPFVDSIIKLGGMIGVGTSNSNPDAFIAAFNDIYRQSNGSLNIAFGTDANGMEPLPKCTPGLNSADFYNGFSLPKSTLGNKTWDYTQTGMAHYGLLPEFIKDVRERPNGTLVANTLNSSADRFILMWEKCERLSATLRAR